MEGCREKLGGRGEETNQGILFEEKGKKNKKKRSKKCFIDYLYCFLFVYVLVY